ncbi:MAG: DUF2249 domain-containing protein [bacterium]
MTTFTDPSLLQCSRVNVLDVRPVLEKGKEPFDSIQHSLSSLSEASTLVIVAPFEPRPLKKYVERQNYDLFYDEVSPQMHWLAVYRNNGSREASFETAESSYVLPAGSGDRIAYLDWRGQEPETPADRVHSVGGHLKEDDLIVAHLDSWDKNNEKAFDSMVFQKDSINSNHIRVEVQAGSTRD